MGTSYIKFVDLSRQHTDSIDDLMTGLEELIRNAQFVGGAPLKEFEVRLADYVGVKYAVGCSDGTSALKLSLLGAGLNPGDEVIVPANSYIASANAVIHAGGRPYFVDCDPQTYLIDLNQVEDRLKKACSRFIMPVHLYGNPCDMNTLLSLSDKRNAIIIEDNAQALGAGFGNKKTGAFGAAAAVSFYPAKNLGAFGQGGALLTDDEQLARRARLYSEQGAGTGEQRYCHNVIGYNDRLHTIQAFVLNTMLPKLDSFNASRLRAADWYCEYLPAESVQKRTDNTVPAYHLFEFCCDSKEHRESVSKKLEAAQIGFGVHYPIPIHRQKAYSGYHHTSLPVSEELSETLISLPMHPFLKHEDVKTVCNVVLTA